MLINASIAIFTLGAALQPAAEPPAPATPPVAAAAARPSSKVSQDRLMATLRGLPTKRAALGNLEHREGLVATEKWLVDQLEQIGLKPQVQEFEWTSSMLEMAIRSHTGSATPQKDPDPADAEKPPARTWRNYIIDLPGTDLPGEVLIYSCHYDAAPNAPGADDDGSGVAAAIELARVLKDSKARRTIRLAFFTLEEVGLIGSIEYVKSRRDLWKATEGPEPKPAAEKVVGMVSMEMLGYYADTPNSQRSPIGKVGSFVPPTVGDFLAIVTVAKFQPFSQRLASEMRTAEPAFKAFTLDFLPIAPLDLLRSDHAPFLSAGVPSVMLTDTANFRNANYHRPTDTVDTIDAAKFTAAVRALAGAAYSIAEPAPIGAVKSAK